jgi:hypothetical protein
MMDKCGHAFRLQVAKKILPRLQVPDRHDANFILPFSCRYSLVIRPR